ncbi:hypothetical protein BC332_19489 [Capsicum chinense]|nr:hypothetical protein BC332_19489 [Capsicum chinense]
MRGTPGYLAPEWLSSVITEKVDEYAFAIVLLEILCGRKNLDWSHADEEDVHLLSVFTRKAEKEQLMDILDRNEDMQLHREAVTEMMSLAAWCLQGDFAKRPSMSLVVKALEGLVTVETNLDYNFSNVRKVGAGNEQREATIRSKLLSILSGPRPLNSTARLSTSWINRPIDFSGETVTPILQVGNDATKFLCGFYCKGHATDCFLGVLLSHNNSASLEGWYISARLVWSANRNHPVKTNATLLLGKDGNLVLAYTDGTFVYNQSIEQEKL